MLWAPGSGEGNVQCLCCNIQPPTSAEEGACHRVVVQLHHSSKVFHRHIDVNEDNCTVREAFPDPTNFPAPSNSLEDASNFFMCLVLLHLARAFGGHHWQKEHTKAESGSDTVKM